MITRIFILIITFGILFSCKNKDNRWDIKTEPLNQDIEIIDVSAFYFDSKISNDSLKRVFPDFFSEATDLILSKRRNDSLNVELQKEVVKVFGDNYNLQDSLKSVFARVKHYYPNFVAPKVYLFTAELPYENPIAYFPESHDMVIGLDWFLGKEYSAYQKMGIPNYFSDFMTTESLLPQIVKSIAKQLVPLDIRKRKFIDKMIYEGKLLIVQDAILPNYSDELKIGYTSKKLEWSKENESSVYLYFTEEDLFFSDDIKLTQRFLDPAPFSKFFSENDTQSPGRIGAWIGWQICKAYLAKNPDMDLVTFLNKEDLEKIFSESAYKPKR